MSKERVLTESIKRDIRAGRTPITLIALSVKSIEAYARQFTREELRHVRFSIPGLCLAAKRPKRKR